jgi:tetratricopeptide (TPR) repeat protein
VILLAALLAAAVPTPGHPHVPADPRPPQARYDACVKESDLDPAAAIATAKAWAASGGGILAAQCLGMAQAAASNWKGSADAFTAAATIAGQLHDVRAASLWVSAGNAALAGGDALRARTALGNALAVPTMDGQMRGEAYLDRARANVAGGDNAGARLDLNSALTLVPGDPMAWLLSATLARRMGDATRATADIREAETRAPNEPNILFESGNIAASAGDMTAARAAWTRAQAADPTGDVGQSAAAELAASGDGTKPAPPRPKPSGR